MRPYLYIRLLGFVLPILATPIPNIGDVGIVVRGEDDKSLGIGVGAVRVKISLKSQDYGPITAGHLRSMFWVSNRDENNYKDNKDGSWTVTFKDESHLERELHYISIDKVNWRAYVNIERE